MLALAALYVKKIPYTQLEYLEATGTQYIKLGLRCNQTSIIKLVSQITDSTRVQRLFGEVSLANARVSIIRGNQNQALWFGSRSVYSSVIATPDYSVPEYFEMRNGSIKVQGVHYETNVSIDFTSLPVYLFKCPNYMEYATAKVYSLSITTDGVEYLMVPVLDDDGVPCLYDTQREICLYNSGSGEFQYALKS